jgi:hypothetical protein
MGKGVRAKTKRHARTELRARIGAPVTDAMQELVNANMKKTQYTQSGTFLLLLLLLPS